jgi:hypothetical protein
VSSVRSKWTWKDWGKGVADAELGFFALQGLPNLCATLVEILELGETTLSLDVIQPKLMQKEQS